MAYPIKEGERAWVLQRRLRALENKCVAAASQCLASEPVDEVVEPRLTESVDGGTSRVSSIERYIHGQRSSTTHRRSRKGHHTLKETPNRDAITSRHSYFIMFQQLQDRLKRHDSQDFLRPCHSEAQTGVAPNTQDHQESKQVLRDPHLFE
ncbi:hypothetical protein CROQUDRAFT_89046 [Cronartium quercuum f. sp. fusiforme G11]|uniref:Uncharacterized protein n=1 Tax=Cronartium quercuum f. sp. fusiforme G11 TaxID=708437 RepID=A0A9P6TG69_9BASI|nr:hypothetical protein CROQUDRAFT_89046 [Cronartium quercuum f. sp. fusiforme G11]